MYGFVKEVADDVDEEPDVAEKEKQDEKREWCWWTGEIGNNGIEILSSNRVENCGEDEGVC